MPPRKIYARMQEVRNHRIYQDSVKIPNALQFALNAQKRVTAAIIAMARESCARWKQAMPPTNCLPGGRAGRHAYVQRYYQSMKSTGHLFFTRDWDSLRSIEM